MLKLKTNKYFNDKLIIIMRLKSIDIRDMYSTVSFNGSPVELKVVHLIYLKVIFH